MNGSPAVPGGPLKSKPTWFYTIECLTTSAFLFSADWRNRQDQLQTVSEKLALKGNIL